MTSFRDKVVVITGASDGIGAQLARRLAAQGAKLVIAARGIEALERVANECRGADANALAVRTDVGIEADCKSLIEQAFTQFGTIDVLVNNAGVSGHAMFDEVTDFKWYEDMMRVNFFGSLWCTHYALPHLKKSRGLIVGVSSLAGRIGVPGRTAYSPSKFAMAGFFDALRIELRDASVDVTMIYPGVVATQIRYRGYGPDGKAAGKSGLEEKGAMSVEECVDQMLPAIASRKRELVMTAKARIGLWLKLIAPKKVDDMALAALKK
jgi:short-subunit dehydrogenase